MDHREQVVRQDLVGHQVVQEHRDHQGLVVRQVVQEQVVHQEQAVRQEVLVHQEQVVLQEPPEQVVDYCPKVTMLFKVNYQLIKVSQVDQII
jgi:hypothetical protein